jgi:hypothetical protein
MFRIPLAAEPLTQAIRQAGVFTRPTFDRFMALMAGLIVTMGRRTVSHSLVAIGSIVRGHWSNYHRIYSQSKFSMWSLAAVLVRQVVALLPKDAIIELVADDTVDGKGGAHVWAKSAHRDPVRSNSHGRTTIKYGHKWLAICVLVQLKGWDRPWALPILCGLCIPSRIAPAIKKRPKSASQLTRQLLMRLMRWFPDRRFILAGDHAIITHRTVSFAQRHAERVTVVGRLRGDANLYAPPADPSRRSRTGERVRKGRKLPPPHEQIQHLAEQAAEVAWYGGSRRLVRYVSSSDQALWYDRKQGLVTPIRWVCVRGEAEQNLLDAYFFCSDVTFAPRRIIEHFARRWNIEVTFEESRALLGLETTRHWCERSVLRVTPILLGLFSAVALIWNQLPAARKRLLYSTTPCYQKTAVTFADALASVRRDLWEQTLLRHRKKPRCLTSLPRPLRKAILWHLSAAA